MDKKIKANFTGVIKPRMWDESLMNRLIFLEPGARGADGPKGPKGDIGLLDLHGQHELVAISGTFWKALT